MTDLNAKTSVRVKVQDLGGDALDWAVLVSLYPIMVESNPKAAIATFKPSSTWMSGGPIIEQMRPTFRPEEDGVRASVVWFDTSLQKQRGVSAFGGTYLVAAMRCYVASKLGDEIEIPVELLPESMQQTARATSKPSRPHP